MVTTKKLTAALFILLSLILAAALTFGAAIILGEASPEVSGEGLSLAAGGDKYAQADLSAAGGESALDALVDEDGIVVTRVVGKTYKGYMAVIDDPKRIFVGTPDAFSEELGGLTVPEMTDKYGAVMGLNGGGYVDIDGVGTGGTPDGLIMQGGNIIWGYGAGRYDVLAFDGEGRLHVGFMTGQECLDAGIQEAVSFGPALIIDGEVQDLTYDPKNNINPRTALGQREDGSVVFLILEGRQVSTLGATLDTLAALMAEAGCINASNLDGGGSSTMEYKDYTFNICGSVYGPRNCVTAFLVAPSGEEAAK